MLLSDPLPWVYSGTQAMMNWIKLDLNILDDAKIKIIRSHPDGNAIIVLWIGLLCLAMKSQRPGIVEISNALPYTLDDLSHLFNIDKKTCELGLVLFKKYKMVDLMGDGGIEIINFHKHQNLEFIDRKRELTRIRVERYRAKQITCNALLTRDSVTVTSTIEEKRREYILSSIKEIIGFLNEKSGKNFSPKTKATIVHIKARLEEGKTVDDFKKVISVKCAKWLKDPKMCDFIRPETLFGSKFEAYLNEHKPERQDPFK
jgi:uncharacterized phage protein (TIGR02220 family)/predicted phage replisome organizer